MSVTEAIVVDGFSKHYGSLAAVTSLSFTVAPGEVLGLCGPNGAGKTTTLRALGGIVTPTLGRVLVCGHDLAREPLAAKARLGFIPDEPALFDHLTVSEHLALMARIYRVPDGTARAAGLLDELELQDKRDELATALSRGMKQKLSVACALIHAPRVLLLDEPLTGLDPIAIRRMKDRILRCAADGAAVVLSSHLLSLVEEMCDRVLFLKRGQKVFHGTLDEIRSLHPELASGSLEDAFLHLTATGGGASPA